MVTTRLQERLGLDTPNSSSVEDASNSTASPSVSRSTKKRTARENETPKNPAKTRASRYSVETEQTTPQPSQSQIDTPVATSEQNLPERFKSPVEFFTPAPAKTPANKRKRFDSDEPEDSILDTFQTPAEYPRTHEVATEGEDQGDDDSDAAPEVVSTRSSARRGRNPPRNSAKSSVSKRSKTTTLADQDNEPTPTSGSVTIDVVKPDSTPSEALAQADENADVRDPAVPTEQAPEADAPATTVEDKDQNVSVANTADNQTSTGSDITVTALPSTSLSNGEGEDERSAVVEAEDTSTVVVEPTVNKETLDDQGATEIKDHEDPPSSSTARIDQQDKPSSHVEFETTTLSPTPPLPVPAVTIPATIAATSKQSVPISSIRSTAGPGPQTTSLHPSSVVEKARVAKKQKISTRRQPASALVHQHLPKPKPTSLSDFRSRMLNRHVRTTDFGPPGQKRVKFVSA